MTASKKFAQTSDSQQSSITLPLFDSRSQLQKLIDAQPPLNHAQVVSKANLTQALKHCFENPGLEDKQAASLMGIDGAQFSRILGGTGHFPTNRYVEFMQTMGNHAPLIWLAHHCGFELRPLKSALQQQLEDERAAHMETQRENAILRQLITERR
jgi:predicted XRE-type DNA-binding protein